MVPRLTPSRGWVFRRPLRHRNRRYPPLKNTFVRRSPFTGRRPPPEPRQEARRLRGPRHLRLSAVRRRDSREPKSAAFAATSSGQAVGLRSKAHIERRRPLGDQTYHHHEGRPCYSVSSVEFEDGGWSTRRGISPDCFPRRNGVATSSQRCIDPRPISGGRVTGCPSSEPSLHGSLAGSTSEAGAIEKAAMAAMMHAAAEASMAR